MSAHVEVILNVRLATTYCTVSWAPCFSSHDGEGYDHNVVLAVNNGGYWCRVLVGWNCSRVLHRTSFSAMFGSADRVTKVLWNSVRNPAE
jgi:hypothetical protein